MRLLFVPIVLALHLPSRATAEDVFGNWTIFPGPNPRPADLLPDAPPEALFRIGQIIFENPSTDSLRIQHQVRELAELPSVADVVKSAKAPPHLIALVKQQLPAPHRFQFEEASVVDYGDSGLMWEVTHALYPSQGGFSGVPFRYRTVLDGRGMVLRPQLIVFDSCFLSPESGWINSTLRLPSEHASSKSRLEPDLIRKRATQKLAQTIGPADGRPEDSLEARMLFRNQERIRIPISTKTDGTLQHTEIWAVNFRIAKRRLRPEEVFTVWVTTDGTVARIKTLKLWPDSDEQHDH